MRPDRSASPDTAFPEPSISLPFFVRDGSDQAFRRLLYSLTSLGALMARNRELFAAYIGVTSPQVMIMSVIVEAGDATVGGVAERLGVSTQFVTMEVNKLIARAIVRKRPNPADRRSMFLSLAPKGEALMRELGPVRRRTNDLTFGSLDAQSARVLQDILDGLVMGARNAVHELEAPHMRGRLSPTAQVSDDTSAPDTKATEPVEAASSRKGRPRAAREVDHTR